MHRLLLVVHLRSPQGLELGSDELNRVLLELIVPQRQGRYNCLS